MNFCFLIISISIYNLVYWFMFVGDRVGFGGFFIGMFEERIDGCFNIYIV